MIQPQAILAVDDNPNLRSVEIALLLEWGYTVYGAGDGAEAMEVLGRHSDIRLIVTDQDMPNLTGLELCRRAKALDPRLKVVMITGGDVTEVAKAAREAGIDELLEKPIYVPKLQAAIKNLLAA